MEGKREVSEKERRKETIESERKRGRDSTQLNRFPASREQRIRCSKYQTSLIVCVMDSIYNKL